MTEKDIQYLVKVGWFYIIQLIRIIYMKDKERDKKRRCDKNIDVGKDKNIEMDTKPISWHT